MVLLSILVARPSSFDFGGNGHSFFLSFVFLFFIGFFLMGLIIRHDRVYHRREITPATATPTPAAADPGPSEGTHLPTSVKALAGFIVVFGLIILGTFNLSVSLLRLSDGVDRHCCLEDWKMASEQNPCCLTAIRGIQAKPYQCSARRSRLSSESS